MAYNLSVLLMIFSLFGAAAMAQEPLVDCYARKNGYVSQGEIRTHLRCVDAPTGKWVNVWFNTEDSTAFDKITDIGLKLILEKSTIPNYWAPTGLTNIAYLSLGTTNGSFYLAKPNLTSGEISENPASFEEIRETFETGMMKKFGKAILLQKNFEVRIDFLHVDSALKVFSERDATRSIQLREYMEDPKNLTNDISLPWD